MKASEIKIGGVYIAKVSGRLTRVRVDAIRSTDAWRYRGGVPQVRGTTVYDVTNITTQRRLTFRSAAKFRGVAATLEQLAERRARFEALRNVIDLHRQY
jgi:hypothetical protein